MTAPRWIVNIKVPPSWSPRDREVVNVAADAIFRQGFEEGARSAGAKVFEQGARAMLRELSARGLLSPGPDGEETIREVVRDREGRISEVIERRVPRRAG